MNQIKPQSRLINQNEVLLKENNHWLYFSNPHQVIAVDKLEDVLPALREVERLVTIYNLYAAGFLSYEAAPAFDSAFQAKALRNFPYLWFGLYPEPEMVTLPKPDEPTSLFDWHSMTDRESYDEAISKIKKYIAAGKAYQVNYTMRLQTDIADDTWDYFLHLAQYQNNHAAYIDAGRYVIGSASPELFFLLDGNVITCRPMKGTTQRGRTTFEDHEQSNWLRSSEKNRAENVMIVDMIRNDLGKSPKQAVCRYPIYLRQNAIPPSGR